MKILILNSILYTAEKNKIPRVDSIKDKMIFNLSMGFVNAGHQVTLIAASEYRPATEEVYPFEVLFFPSFLPCLFSPALLPLHPRLISYLRKHKESFDLIISSEIFSFNSLFASLIAPRKTIIWSELGQHNRKFHKIPSYLWYHVVARLLMRRSLVVPRSRRAGKFAGKFGLKVYDGFITHGANSYRLRENKIKKNHLVVVGQLIPRKNIFSILEKYVAFVRKHPTPHYKLYLIGDGPMRKEIETFISANKLEDRIYLTGNLSHDELGEILSSAQCMLCDSLQELCMIAPEESIFTATPVITNTIPYNSDWMNEHRLGIVKDGWNEDDIYEIISNNTFYVDNCSRYAPLLSQESIAGQFLKCIKF